MTGEYLVKKYANRKLYDTVARRYVTLDVVAELLRRGTDVRVIDQVSGADITDATVALLGRPGRRSVQPSRPAPARRPAMPVKGWGDQGLGVLRALMQPLEFGQRAIEAVAHGDRRALADEIDTLRAQVVALSHDVERLLGEIAELRPVSRGAGR